jgi:hypothetical protein
VNQPSKKVSTTQAIIPAINPALYRGVLIMFIRMSIAGATPFCAGNEAD